MRRIESGSEVGSGARKGILYRTREGLEALPNGHVR